MPYHNSPLVSIVIPVYNGANFLAEAIDSALAQTYPNIEIIVVNDGSNDNGETEKIALSYSDKIKYFSQENGGVAAALNTAIAKMSGEYFSWLSHDDLYFPNKVQAQVDALMKMERRDVVLYSDLGIFYSTPDTLRICRLPGVDPDDFRYTLTVSIPVNGCSLLIPKQAFFDCGIFDTKLRYTQDYDLWFRMAEKYKFIHIPKILVKSRSHPGQDTVKLKDAALVECNKMVIGFAQQLTPQEIMRNTGSGVAAGYAVIVFKNKARGNHAGRAGNRKNGAAIRDQF